MKNICKSASRKKNALSRLSFFLTYRPSYLLIWMFSSIRSCRKINKLHERSLRLCHNDYTSSFDELLSKKDLVNIDIRYIQLLMIEIFKSLKGISPPIMNEILRLRNILYTMQRATFMATTTCKNKEK